MKVVAKKISAAALSVIIAAACLCFSACGLFDVSVSSISFESGGETVTETAMTLGGILELDRMVTITPSLASDKSYTVTSDDESVVKVYTRRTGSVSMLVAEAVGVGGATLTASTEKGSKTATLDITVSYALADTVEIKAPDDFTFVRGTVILGEEDLNKPLAFTAAINAYADPDTQVNWCVSGAEEPTMLEAGEAFEFTPLSLGAYEITASVTDGLKNYSDSLTVAVYGDITGISVDYSGSLTQKAGEYSFVEFTANYVNADENSPEPIVEWYVNGEAQAYSAESGARFSFLPSSPGLHEIECRINGVKADTVAVRVSGVLLPQNVYVDCDNCYPEIWVRWDALPSAAGFEVQIVDSATGRQTGSDLNTRNNALKSRFTSSGFNATGYISDIFSTSYSVRVKTLGDGEGLLSESDFSAAAHTSVMPQRAKTYLESKFYDGERNRYISSYEEFYEWFEYAMLWRTAQIESGETLYLAYAHVSAMDEIEKAMKSQHFTGSYQYSGKESRVYKNECTFTIEFGTDGAPSKRTSAPHGGEAWNAMRPHVNYDESKARPAKYAFAIDKLAPVTVETTDQLYYLAQLGYNPVPKSGSAAANAYNYARRTLRYIVTDDMSEADKVHAIYDWIMWRNIYDYEVLKYTALSEAVKYEAYYLESIFSDSNNYGVCDAMSKAFTFMCRTEGIECVRVTGTAGSGRDSGGHAWNKVKVDGQWYIADCTWGDAGVQLVANGSARESASHMYLLLSDSDVADTHFEDEGQDFPATAAERYPWYENGTTYGDREMDIYLESSLTQAQFVSEVRELCDGMVAARDSAQSDFRVGFDEINRTASSYYAFEIVSDAKWGTGERSALRTQIETALRGKSLTLRRDYWLFSSEMGGKEHTLVFFRN